MSDLATDPPKPTNAEPEERLLSPATAETQSLACSRSLLPFVASNVVPPNFRWANAEWTLEDVVRELLNSTDARVA